MTTTPPEPDQPFGAGQPPYPGAQQPPQPYGAFPTDPSAAPRQAPPVPPQPSTIALAVKLMFAGAALSLVSLAYSVTTFGDLKDQIREQLAKDDVNVSQATIDAAYAVSITFAVIFGLVGTLLWLWMAWKNGQGRSWARVVSSVFGGLNLLGVLFTVSAGNVEPLTVVLSLVNLALAVVILVLLWRRPSTDFYEGSAASRRMY